jgi:hypothetical protein
MLGGPPGAPYTASESKDGTGSGDHNAPYTFVDTLNAEHRGPFTLREFCKLTCLRSHVHSGDRAYVESRALITAPVE